MTKHFIFYPVFLCIFILNFSFGIIRGFAEEEEVPEPSESISIEATLKAESENISELKNQFGDLKELDKGISEQMNAYKIQLSNYGNLLVSPKVRIEDMEKAWAAGKIAEESISQTLKDLAQKHDAVTRLLEQTEEQYALNEKQLLEIDTEVSNISDMEPVIDNLQRLVRILSVKINYLEEFQSIYAEDILELEGIRNAFLELSEKFNQQIQVKEKEELFRRKEGTLFLIDLKQIREELNLLIRPVGLAISKEFWQNTLAAVWNSEGVLLLSSLLIFGVIHILLSRFHRHFFSTDSLTPEYPWRNLILQIFDRSRFLFGTTLFFYAYAHFRHFYATVPFLRVLIYILLTWLFSQWVLDFLFLWNQREKNRIPPPVAFRIRILLILIRLFAIPYIIMAWLLKSDSMILLFGRVFFEVALVIWGILFWKIFREPEAAPSEEPRKPAVLKLVLLGLGDIVVGGGLVLEFAGYGSLAIYWYSSWACTSVSLLWGWLFFCLLREWNKRFKASSAPGPAGTPKPVETLQWLFIRISGLAWLGLFSLSLLFAWGAKQTVIVSFFRIMGKEVTIGGMQLSVLKFVCAFLILLCTHAVAHIWRNTVIKKILEGSGLISGVRHSIANITVYTLWIFGILISLNVAGFSTTSLMVAFGTLGIGIGFGLQNIFNNFISGIILLFERPIQVGDVVEINGVWGEVRKINVRSTWVETYDNASLIIPNADFISGQVINWTSKDPKVRRILKIGVAYGSDVELVRRTLLEIAGKTPLVFRNPSPSVLFRELGESALIFELRFWAHVDNCTSSESEILFEINRLFRERNIEIPFPRRDVHIFKSHSGED
ncbi:mechanosensitive ion channel [Desulfobacterales bacterium HSG2]|nr:mechanosensitive ion channel [Desulfobacterales bacterium HSG2]